MGPLDGLTIVEIAGIGPAPFCAMMLADMGADVVRVDRADRVLGADPNQPPTDIMNRGRRSVGVNLKSSEGVEVVMRLVESANGLIEGFRPGVAERLGIGPQACLARNPRVVYGRMTGWGQHGPYASVAGHDINYVALSGTLDAIGRVDTGPVPPMNLVGDFGGGGMYLAFGMVCGILEAQASGQGQVVDAAMVDGAASLATFVYGLRALGMWDDKRGTNMLDTGAPYYDVYRCADGKYVSIGSIERQFYAELREKLDLDDPKWDAQNDKEQWPDRKADLAAIFETRTREQWCELFEGSDVCFAPVLSMQEAPDHPHNHQRGTFTEIAGVVQPRPAPRFSRTDGDIRRPPPHAGQHSDELLSECGFSDAEIAGLRSAGAVA